MARPRIQHALLFFITVFTQTSSTIAQQCYFPDGTPSPDVACTINSDSSSSSVGSPCCSSIAMCLDNGLCMGKGLVSRGSCTDKNWGPGCTEYCKDTNPGGGVPMWPCRDGGNWTCNPYNAQGICDQDSKFTITGGSGFILRPAQVGSDEGITVNATTELELANATATNNPDLAVTSAPPAAAAAASTSAADDGGKFSAGQLAGAVVGVGVPLLLALGGAIFVILKQRRQLKGMESATKGGEYTQIHQPQVQQPPSHSWQEPGYQNWGSKQELGSQRVEEMDGSRTARELSAD